MKIRAFLLLCFAFLLASSAHAQVEHVSGYRLRVPTAEEYLETVIQIAAQRPEPSSNNQWINRTLYSTIIDLLFKSYPNLFLEDFRLLLETYQALDIGSDWVYGNTRQEWNIDIIHAWLRQHHIDLKRISEIRFADYWITVIPRDFDGDGSDEYVLDISKGSQTNRSDCRYDAEYVDYLVVQQHEDAYEFVLAPFRWFGQRHPNENDTGLKEIRFEDINADGLPEWILVEGGFTGGGPAMGYTNHGHLFVLGWRDSTLVDLTQASDETGTFRITDYQEEDGWCMGALPRDITWEFTNVDNDKPLEILQHQVYVDSWYCEFVVAKTFDWDAEGDVYQLGNHSQNSYVDSRNCAQRQAEELTWAQDYEGAISFYERGLNLDPYKYAFLEGVSDLEPYQWLIDDLNQKQAVLDQYMKSRLALAYLMTGEKEKAQERLQQLKQEPVSSEAIGYFIETLTQAYESNLNPLQTCVSAYDAFTNHYPSVGSSNVYSDPIYLGITLVMPYEYEWPAYSPEHIGCDALATIQQVVSSYIFNTSSSPVEGLENLGLEVSNYIQSDLNDDGQPEWLIWLKTPLNPIFLAADGDSYHISYPEVDPYGKSEGVSTWRLPDDASTAIAYINFAQLGDAPQWERVYDKVGGWGGSPACILDDGVSREAGKLKLWQMTNWELMLILDEIVCEDSLNLLFPEGEGSNLFRGRKANYEGTIYEPLMYTWDETKQTFVAPIEPTPEITQTSQSEITAYTSAEAAFEANDHSVVVEMTNALSMQAENSSDFDYLMRQHFYRALALEALNRPDEALAEYIAIYTNETESAWGMLAALHFEKSES